MANIESNTGVYLSSENEKGQGDCSVFLQGDVLFGKLRPYLNKVYFAEFNGGCTTEFIVMDSLNETIISNKFLSIFLLLDCVVNQTKYMMTGNTLPRLQTFDIENFIVPVPSKDIQQNIIDMMEKAYELKKQKEKEAQFLLDSIDDYLFDKLAIKLPVEPENNIENRTYKVGFDDIFGSRFDGYYNKPYYLQVEEELHKTNYDLYNLIELCNGIRGVTYSSNDEENSGTIGILRGNNINLKTNELDLTDIRYLKDSFIVNENQKLQKHDILMSAASGSKEHVGKVAFIEDDLDYYFGAFMMVLRVYNDKVNPFYLFGYLQSKLFRQLLMRILGGTNINNLNFNMIKNYKIPLPDIIIQNEIANEIKQRREKAKQFQNEAKEELKNAKKEVEKIILGEAYES